MHKLCKVDYNYKNQKLEKRRENFKPENKFPRSNPSKHIVVIRRCNNVVTMSENVVTTLLQRRMTTMCAEGLCMTKAFESGLT